MTDTMTYETRDDRFSALIDPTARLRKIAGDLGFTEGPILCQSVSNRDPLSASKFAPFGAELARRCVVSM